MEENNTKTLITFDQNVGQKEAQGLISGGTTSVSAEELMALARAAERTHSIFTEHIRTKMTPERAERIRQLRVDEGYSWPAWPCANRPPATSMKTLWSPHGTDPPFSLP
jgi:hypothetical protein